MGFNAVNKYELAKSSLSLSAVVRVRLGEFDEAKERLYRRRFSNHKQKTGTIHAIEDFFWSNRAMTDILQKLNAGHSEIADKERIKLSALYTDFDGDGVLCPRDWFTAKEKVEGTLQLTRLRIEVFRANVVPIFAL